MPRSIFNNVVFCRVCGFRVKVCKSYRTSRSFGYGHGSVRELTEVPGIVARTYRNHRSSGKVQKCCTWNPCFVTTSVQKSQKFRVRVWTCGNYRSSGYGYECPTELREVLYRVLPGVKTPGMVLHVPYRTQSFNIKYIYWDMMFWHGVDPAPTTVAATI